MSTMIALFLMLSTLAGCAGETAINVKNALPPPEPPPAVFQVDLTTTGDTLYGEDGTELASFSYEIPVLSATGGGEDAQNTCGAFNELFSAWNENGETLANTAREDRALYEEIGAEFFPYSDELRCAVYQTGRLVSVAGTYCTYTGGAHSNTVLLSWNFDLETGAFFNPALLDEEAGFHDAVVRALAAQARDRARENGMLPTEFFWEDYQDTLENWSSYAVSFDGEGMRVGFSPYELACYAAGPQVFQIPYGELSGYLSEQGRALLGLGG